jgi:hypothetical protein
MTVTKLLICIAGGAVFAILVFQGGSLLFQNCTYYKNLMSGDPEYCKGVAESFGVTGFQILFLSVVASVWLRFLSDSIEMDSYRKKIDESRGINRVNMFGDLYKLTSSWIDFGGYNFKEQSIDKLEIKRVSFYHRKNGAAKIDNATFNCCNFYRVNFGLRYGGAELINTKFIDCKFTNVSFRNCIITANQSDFEIFRNTNGFCDKIDFSDAVLININIENARFKAVRYWGARLQDSLIPRIHYEKMRGWGAIVTVEQKLLEKSSVEILKMTAILTIQLKKLILNCDFQTIPVIFEVILGFRDA